MHLISCCKELKDTKNVTLSFVHFYLDFLLVNLNRCWAHLTCCCCFSLLLLLAILHVIRHVAKYVVVADYALQICSRHNLHSRKKKPKRGTESSVYIHRQPAGACSSLEHGSPSLPFSVFFSSRHLNEVGASCHTSLAIATAAAAADYARGPAKAINMQRKTTTTNTICCTTTTTTIIMNIRKFVRQLMAN